jgi:endo-1,4-beta-xylanase
MISRRALLAQLAGATILTPGATLARTSDRPLRRAAAAKGILFGTAAANYELRDHDFLKLLPRQAAILVAEYEMKRNILEPARGVYDFSASDALVEYARAYGLKFRGHTLVWYAANPHWLADAVLHSRNETLMTGYINKVARHYRGHMRSWDVVNEALLPQDERADGLRESFWLKAFGPTYIDTAFHAAHAADPHAHLVYNDWGCEAGAAYNDRFRALTLKFLDGLLARRVPIHGLGMQGHLSAFGAPIDQRKLRDFLEEVEARGLSILITEMDVDDSGGPPGVAQRDTAAADVARRFLDVMLDNRAVKTVLTWGLSDRYLDPPDWRDKLKGWKSRKLPYDIMLQKKPLWYAMEDAFALARRR